MEDGRGWIMGDGRWGIGYGAWKMRDGRQVWQMGYGVHSIPLILVTKKLFGEWIPMTIKSKRISMEISNGILIGISVEY